MGGRATDPTRVFFTDVPCTKCWAELLIKDDAQSGNGTKLTDKKVNSIISGYDGSVPAAQFVRDAAYVIDLTVEENAELYTGVQFETGATDVRIYYTGTATIDGAITCLDGTTNCGDRYYAIDTVTIYGDFDGDSSTPIGRGPDDYDFVNAHFPCSSTDDEDCADYGSGDTYNPLVDYDCDDRAQFLAHFPAASGNLEDDDCP